MATETKQIYQENNQVPPVAQQVGVLNTAPVQGNVCPSGNQHFKVRAGWVTGAIQILCAVLSAALGIVAVLLAVCISDRNPCVYSYSNFAAFIGWPIWGAVCFYLVAGIIGVSTGSKNTCVIVAYMVMSILAALSAAGQVIMESIGAVFSSTICYSVRTPDVNGYTHYDWVCVDQHTPPAIHSLAAIVAFVEMIVAIVGAAYCCHGVCCRTAPQQVVVRYATITPGAQFQTFTPAPAQPVPASAPPAYQELAY